MADKYKRSYGWPDYLSDFKTLYIEGIVREGSVKRKMANLVRLFAGFYTPFAGLFTLLFVIPQYVLSLFLGDWVIMENLILFFYAPLFFALLVALLPLMPILAATGFADGNLHPQTSEAMLHVIVVAVVGYFVARFLLRAVKHIVKCYLLGIGWEDYYE